MHIRVGHEISLSFLEPTAMILMLRLHPSRAATIRKAERYEINPATKLSEYIDEYGNRCERMVAPSGRVTFRNDLIVEDSGEPDPQIWDAPQRNVQDLPDDALRFLLSSRYCEVDSELKLVADALSGQAAPGWRRVQSICDFVHGHLQFNYLQARANRTALDAYREGIGVCRDYTHLAITLCRIMNIPARYCTGYLGDIRAPIILPMDFSAWFEVYLGDGWHIFDARNNTPRIGRVLMARGRDAADVALTTTFGFNELQGFTVWAYELSREEELAEGLAASPSSFSKESAAG
jgi:transglutaminase-like putative cysteine protease